MVRSRVWVRVCDRVRVTVTVTVGVGIRVATILSLQRPHSPQRGGLLSVSAECAAVVCRRAEPERRKSYCKLPQSQKKLTRANSHEDTQPNSRRFSDFSLPLLLHQWSLFLRGLDLDDRQRGVLLVCPGTSCRAVLCQSPGVVGFQICSDVSMVLKSLVMNNLLQVVEFHIAGLVPHCLRVPVH